MGIVKKPLAAIGCKDIFCRRKKEKRQKSFFFPFFRFCAAKILFFTRWKNGEIAVNNTHFFIITAAAAQKRRKKKTEGNFCILSQLEEDFFLSLFPPSAISTDSKFACAKKSLFIVVRLVRSLRRNSTFCFSFQYRVPLENFLSSKGGGCIKR